MNRFKRISTFCTALFLAVVTLCSGAEAQDVTSDYQVKKDYRSKYKVLSERIDSADTPDEIENIIERIKSFEEQFASHDTLLNKVLHPKTFYGQLESLKMRAVMTQNRLVTIKKQKEKLARLGGKISDYDSRLSRLNKQTDSLRAAMQESIKNEKRLSSLVRRYRQNLERRDELIVSMIDSVLVTYENLDMASVKNMEKVTKKARIGSGGNVLKMVQSIADQNVSFLDSNPTLSTNSLLRMNVVQQRFEEMWNKVGHGLAVIYAEENPEKAYQSMDKTLSRWDKAVTSRTWSSLNGSFDQAGIKLDTFSNPDSFYQSLTTYLDKSIEKSRNGNSDALYEKYQNFTQFWHNRVKPEWAAYMPQADVLSARQIAKVDRRVDRWAVRAEPESSLFVYLLGVSIVAVVVLGTLLFREKRDNGA